MHSGLAALVLAGQSSSHARFLISCYFKRVGASSLTANNIYKQVNILLVCTFLNSAIN